VDYREYRVPWPLAAMVECVWFLRGAAGADGEPTQRVLPDGCLELIAHFGDVFESIVAEGATATAAAPARATRQASSLVVGLLTRPLLLRPPACVETMGIRFRPGGAYPFIAVPLAELTDTAISVDDLWGAAGRSLIERLANTRDDEARLAIVTQVLTSRLVSARAADPLIDNAIAALVRTAGCAGIADLANRAGVTTRHLQRRFQERVGVSPKVLARILRFQNTLRHRSPGSDAEATTPIEWAHVAVACGYADQSHLIREYAALAGETPASLLAAEGELSGYFTSPQRLAALLGARR
jgi:AraC-like DNA-binding protein